MVSAFSGGDIFRGGGGGGTPGPATIPSDVLQGAPSETAGGYLNFPRHQGAAYQIQLVEAPAWDTTRAYVPGELARDPANRVYVCLTAQDATESGPANSAKWGIVSGYAGAWTTGRYYDKGEVLDDDGEWYVCLADIGPSTTAPGADSTHFQALSSSTYDLPDDVLKGQPTLDTDSDSGTWDHASFPTEGGTPYALDLSSLRSSGIKAAAMQRNGANSNTIQLELTQESGTKITTSIGLGFLDDFKGTWNRDTDYILGEIVQSLAPPHGDGLFYFCKDDRAAQPAPGAADPPNIDPTHWFKLGTDGVVASGTGVLGNDHVLTITLKRSEGLADVVLTADLSALAGGGAGGNSVWKGGWASGGTYGVGDEVRYSGAFYKTDATKGSSDTTTPDADADWQLLSDVAAFSDLTGEIALTQIPDTIARTSQLAGLVTKATVYAQVKEIIKVDTLLSEATDDDSSTLTISGTALPVASTTAQGIIEIATGTEADTGTDATRAMTPSTVRRQTGGRVSAAERTAGSSTGVRRFSPSDVKSMVDTFGGLTQAQVDARVTALVEAAGLIANGSVTWAKSKLPSDVIYTAALTTALASYSTTTEMDAAIAKAIDGLDFSVWEDNWGSGTAYTKGNFVRHNAATYVCIANVSANTAASSEPGVGSAWQTSWYRVGYQNGPPNAFIDAKVNNNEVVFSREGGTNPQTITLPAAEQGSVYRFYAHPTLTTVDISSPTAIPTATDYEITILDSEEITGAVEAGNDFITDWEGGFHGRIDTAGTLEIILETGHVFNGKTLTHQRSHLQDVVRNGSFFLPFGIFNSRSAVSLGVVPGTNPPVTITAADLAGPTTITYKLIFKLFQRRSTTRQTGNITELNWENAQTFSYQLGAVPPTPPPATNPSVKTYDVTGDKAPAPGSIAGDSYSYTIAISQPGHVTAARIIGFAGAGTKARPSAFTSLATLSDYSSATGSVAIPAGTTLANAGDQYTLRLEVFGDGQTTADQPVAYSDYTITARAATALVHFGTVLRAQDASNVDFDKDFTAGTKSQAAGTWVIGGIPDDSGATLYRLYFAVPAADTQPTSWTEAGASITDTFEAAVDRTIDSVDYKIYLTQASGPYSSYSNGTVIVVS